nr:MAG TPA: hypothetical protein [Caudoviricetes sp.]DAQ82575.1 MAG TPA: hypothetical protein [Caudoviricetes sp.]
MYQIYNMTSREYHFNSLLLKRWLYATSFIK